MNTAPKIEPKQWLIGMAEISRYMSWSPFTVKRYVLKYGFPAWRQSAKVPGAIAWRTSIQDIAAWTRAQQDVSWHYLAASKTGKRFMSTRAKSVGSRPPRRPSRYLTKAANDRLMPTTNV